MEATTSLTIPDRLSLAVTGLEPDAVTTLRGAFEWAAEADGFVTEHRSYDLARRAAEARLRKAATTGVQQ